MVIHHRSDISHPGKNSMQPAIIIEYVCVYPYILLKKLTNHTTNLSCDVTSSKHAQMNTRMHTIVCMHIGYIISTIQYTHLDIQHVYFLYRYKKTMIIHGPQYFKVYRFKKLVKQY
jgi:hypothetical protein